MDALTVPTTGWSSSRGAARERLELWAALLPVVDVLAALDVPDYIGGSVASWAASTAGGR